MRDGGRGAGRGGRAGVEGKKGRKGSINLLHTSVSGVRQLPMTTQIRVEKPANGNEAGIHAVQVWAEKITPKIEIMSGGR